jgi:hypothetical protein
LSGHELDQLPENSSSDYINTGSTGIVFHIRELTGQFSIMLKSKPQLPLGAYLEAHFPDPANPTNSVVVGKVRRGAASELLILSPNLKGFKCGNYQVVVYVYRGKSKSVLLDTHEQSIQSKINLEKVKNPLDLVKAIAIDKGNCS